MGITSKIKDLNGRLQIDRLRWWRSEGESTQSLHLSGDIIEEYLKLYTKTKEKVIAMSPFFLKWEKDRVVVGEKPPKNFNVFNYNTIIVPVNTMHCNNPHWEIAIIDMQSKRITHFDSLGKKDILTVNALLEYLETQSATFSKNEWDVKYETIKQENDYDCGVFICIYARGIKFTQEHISSFRQLMFYEICSANILNNSTLYCHLLKRKERFQKKPKKNVTSNIQWPTCNLNGNPNRNVDKPKIKSGLPRGRPRKPIQDKITTLPKKNPRPRGRPKKRRRAVLQKNKTEENGSPIDNNSIP